MNHTIRPVHPEVQEFSWEILRSFMDGVSPIDLENLSLESRQDAFDFLVHYGYDLSVPGEVAESHQIIQEALAYLRHQLCPAPTPEDRSLVLPQELQDDINLPGLLMLASQKSPLQPWACALLRVMHTISHANHAVRSPFYSQIKEQILERYRAHLHRDEQGRCWLGLGADAVPLVAYSFREEKSRESLILKLLHKPDNVAQSVFDRIGVRLVTEDKMDALLVVRYLRLNNLAIFANIMPGRSKNSLVDLQLFRSAYQMATAESKGRPYLEVLDSLREQSFQPLVPVPLIGELNPHSSQHFRSIQFTCRQLIRVVNPMSAAAADLRAKLQGKLPPDDVSEILSSMEHEGRERVLRFFFPYEVQIMDEENYLRNESGEGSHANYRVRQLRTARRRILGTLLAGYASSEV